MFRESIYIVHDPDGDNFAFRDITTAQTYVKKHLITDCSTDLINNYLKYVEDLVCFNCEEIPMSLLEFCNVIVNGDITDYDYSIECLPIFTNKDF